MPLRDLDIRVEINSFDDELKSANEQCDELVNNVEDAGESLDDMSSAGQMAGESTAESMDKATESTQGLVSTLHAAGVEFDALAAAGAAFLKSGIEAYAKYEAAVQSLRIETTARDFVRYMRWIDEEVERTRRYFTAGQLADILRPVVATLPGQADKLVRIFSAVNDKLIAMGASSETAMRAYQALSAAIAQGTGTMLTRASRTLPVPIISSPKAIEIINQMSKELGVAGNTMLLFKAIEADTQIKQKDLNAQLETTEMRLYRLRQTWGDFLEQVGYPYNRLVGETAESAQHVLATITDNGWARGISRVAGVGTAIFGILGAWRGLSFVLSKIGMELTVGGVASAVVTFGKWAVVAAAVAVAIDDIWAAIEHRPSLTGTFIAEVKKLPSLYEQYVNRPFWNFFETIVPNAFISLGHRIKEFFTVDVYNALVKFGNALLDTPVLGWILRHLGMEKGELRVHTEPTLRPGIDFTSEVQQPGTYNEILTNEEGQVDTIWRNLPLSVKQGEQARKPTETVITGRTAQVVSDINDQLNKIVQQEQEASPVAPVNQGGQNIPGISEESVVPLPDLSGFTPAQKEVHLTLNVSPGAIQVTGGDPDATADAIKEKLKEEFMLELESQLAGGLDRPTR